MPPSGHARILIREELAVPAPQQFQVLCMVGREDLKRKGHLTLGGFRTNGYQYFIAHLSVVHCPALHVYHLILSLMESIIMPIL